MLIDQSLSELKINHSDLFIDTQLSSNATISPTRFPSTQNHRISPVSKKNRPFPIWAPN